MPQNHGEDRICTNSTGEDYMICFDRIDIK